MTLNNTLIKLVGTSFKTSVNPLEVRCDGYLLEPVKAPNKDGELEAIGYELLVGSFIGSKSQCEGVLRTWRKEDLYLQDLSHNGDTSGTGKEGAFRKNEFYKVFSRKEDVSIETQSEHVMGSLYRRTVVIDSRIRPDLLNGDATAAYLVGEDKNQARSLFWNVLDKLPCPIHPDWETHLWLQFRNKEWIESLIGHRMAGYRISIDKEAILELVADLVEQDKLPNIIPSATADEAIEPKGCTAPIAA